LHISEKVYIFAVSITKIQKRYDTKKFLIMEMTKPPINPKLRYNRQAVSRALNVNVNTVDRWRDKGYLTAQKEENRQVTYLGAEILKMWELRLI